MAALDIFFITINHNITFLGKTWWMMMVGLRLFVILLVGFTLFGDEQERFVCNTIQPGCSNVCFDLFAPVSLLRLWLLQLVLLSLPHLLFGSYMLHKVLKSLYFWPHYYSRSQGSSCNSRQISNSSRETSLSKAPFCDPLLNWKTPTFHCAYILVVILRILLETVFGASQVFLFGLSIPRSFLCYEAPCTSGVECYISRSTEKTLAINFMLSISSVSVLVSLFDLVGSMKVMLSHRSKRQRLMEEMSKGEQSSVFTSTSGSEDTGALLTKRGGTNGDAKDTTKDHKVFANEPPYEVFSHAKMTSGSNKALSVHENSSGCKDVKTVVPPSPTPVPSHLALHNQLKSMLRSQQPGGGWQDPVEPTTVGTRKVGQYSQVGTVSDHHYDSKEAQDKRAWV